MDYNEEKATAVACLFLERAGGKLDDLKLMIPFYLADREALRHRSSSITGVSASQGSAIMFTKGVIG